MLIFRRRLIEMIEGQGKQLGEKFTDPLEATGTRIRQIEQWKKMARYWYTVDVGEVLRGI